MVRRRIARQGTPVVQSGKIVGEVASGTFSPTLQKSIAMAYVDAAREFAERGAAPAQGAQGAATTHPTVPNESSSDRESQ